MFIKTFWKVKIYLVCVFTKSSMIIKMTFSSNCITSKTWCWWPPSFLCSFFFPIATWSWFNSSVFSFLCLPIFTLIIVTWVRWRIWIFMTWMWWRMMFWYDLLLWRRIRRWFIWIKNCLVFSFTKFYTDKNIANCATRIQIF
jgi:hypothetical protein